MTDVKADSKKNDGIDLEKLSFEDLLKLQAQVKEKFDEKQKAEKEKAIAEMQAKIKLFGIEAHELGFSAKPTKSTTTKGAGQGKGHVAPKYRSEEGQEWSGRGRTPAWAQEKISKDGREAFEKKYAIKE